MDVLEALQERLKVGQGSLGPHLSRLSQPRPPCALTGTRTACIIPSLSAVWVRVALPAGLCGGAELPSSCSMRVAPLSLSMHPHTEPVVPRSPHVHAPCISNTKRVAASFTFTCSLQAASEAGSATVELDKVLVSRAVQGLQDARDLQRQVEQVCGTQRRYKAPGLMHSASPAAA